MPGADLMVVDDGSRDDTKDFLRDYEKRASCKYSWFSQENTGMGVAFNKGIKNSSGEIICFSNDDCVADIDWIKNLVDGYVSDDVVCVGGSISAYKTETLSEKYSDKRRLVSQETFLACGPIITANTSYRRREILSAGGFDEELKAAVDGDLGIRLKLVEAKFVYNREAVVLHKHRTSILGLLRQQYAHAVGVTRLYKKYPQHFKPVSNVLPLAAKTMVVLFTYPIKVIKAPSVKDKKYYMAEPLLDILSNCVIIFGITKEALLGESYKGKRHTETLGFLPEQKVGRRLHNMLKNKANKTKCIS